MNRPIRIVALMALSAGCVVGCSSEPRPAQEQTGEAEVALTNTPRDVACLRLTVTGDGRTDVRAFPLSVGTKAVFKLKGLPPGKATFSADAFNVACPALSSTLDPTWYSEAVVSVIKTGQVSHVALRMIHNGRASIGVDFNNGNAPTATEEAAVASGTTSSQKPYVIPVAAGVQVKAILSVGDAAGKKPDGTAYRMVGIPDGLGAFDNADGSFTLLSNHELQATQGIARAHGAAGAFVSKWKIRKSDLAVLDGQDLIQNIVLWNAATSSYNAPTTGVAFGRFCSADLPARGATFDAATGLGFDGELFFDGEETDDEGRGFAHALDGTSYELPRLGKFAYENSVPNPDTGVKTIVAGLDDSSAGQVYFYAGTKTASGSPIEKAGLTNGVLFGLKVTGVVSENPASGIPDGAFTMHAFGNVENWTGAKLQAESVAHAVTGFQRPEDGAWDPNNRNHFYFVTTASFTGNSRLWRLRFKNASQPQQGGTIELLLNGSEGQKMFDNITLDRYGHVYLQEDPGNQDHIAKIWRYDIESDTLVELAKHEPTFFDPTLSSPTFITKDEESSGIIDASDLLGPGWFLLDVQAHRSLSDPELVQDGQFLALFDPASTG